jgi:hypothetical protein
MKGFRGTEHASVKKKRQIDVNHAQEGMDPAQSLGSAGAKTWKGQQQLHILKTEALRK